MILYRPASPFRLWYALATLIAVSLASAPLLTGNVRFSVPGVISAILRTSSIVEGIADRCGI